MRRHGRLPGVGKQPTPEWVLRGVPKAGEEEEKKDEDQKEDETTKLDISESQDMAVDSGTTVASGIGEKRDEHSVELSSSSSSKIRKVQTVSGTTISPVEKVATMKGPTSEC